MDNTEFIGNWNLQKSKLKLKFAALTDNDLLFAKGKKEEMIANLQIILGKTKEEIDEILENL